VTDVLTPADKVFTTVPLDMPLLEVTHMITGTKQTCFPVVDPRGDYYGVFELNDIREFLYESEEVGRLAVAQDLALRGEEPLTLQMDLGQAIRRFAEVSYDELPVVDENEPKTVIALLRRHDIITAYNRRLANLRMRKESHHAF
jgi:chloride channel protein, CIC family